MPQKSKFWYLSHFNIFEGMDDRAMMAVDRVSSMIDVRPHEPIYFPDEPSSAVFFLKEGHVKISRLNEDGKEIILDILGPGEIFGEVSLLEESPGPANEFAQALDRALICTMKKSDFEVLIRHHPSVTMELTKRIGLRLRRFEERLTDLVFKDVRRRLASFLIKYSDSFGKIRNGIITIRAPLSHQEIGLLTGTTRQSVTTILNEFRTSGLIEFDRTTITIRDPKKLRGIAK